MTTATKPPPQNHFDKLTGWVSRTIVRKFIWVFSVFVLMFVIGLIFDIINLQSEEFQLARKTILESPEVEAASGGIVYVKRTSQSYEVIRSEKGDSAWFVLFVRGKSRNLYVKVELQPDRDGVWQVTSLNPWHEPEYVDH